MRRLLQMVAGIVMLTGTVGCYTLSCTTGVCDCEPNCCDKVRGFVGCGGCGPVAVHPVQPVVVAQPITPPAPRQLPPPVDK
jgi:hypothetical protein